MASAHIEYNNQYVAQNLIDIEDVGNCAIEASNEEGLFYYIILKTTMGTTTIATCGPVVPDVTFLPDGFSTSLTRMKYNDDKVELAVIKWLNDKKKIVNATIISEEDAIEQFRDLKDYLINFSDEVY